jgi:hypothetical protein
LVIDKSADPFTVVSTGPTLLLPLLGSFVVLATLALLLMVPVAVGVTTIEIVALPGKARLPTLQVTVPADGVHEPWLGVAETNVTLPGKVSVTVTADAAVGPLLVTVIE